MNDSQVKAILNVITPSRLAIFKRAVGNDPQRMLRLYAWDIEAAGAFLGPLRCLEVALRGIVHDAMQSHFAQLDWWDVPGLRLHAPAQNAIDNVKEKYQQRNQLLTPAGMISELSLGFWVSLFGRGDDYETRFWRPILSRVFPGFAHSRRAIHRKLDDVRLFRNKIAHHEPIFYRDLNLDHDGILDLLERLSPEKANWVRDHDRVPEVLQARAATCDGLRMPSF